MAEGALSHGERLCKSTMRDATLRWLAQMGAGAEIAGEVTCGLCDGLTLELVNILPLAERLGSDWTPRLTLR